MIKKYIAVLSVLYCIGGVKSHAVEATYSAIEKKIVNHCGAWFDSKEFSFDNARDSKFEIKEVSGGICMDGPIHRNEAELKFKSKTSNLVDGSDLTVVVRSPGGEGRPAVNIAEEISRLRSTVVGFDLCASACANYIMAAAKKRIVHDDALLLFHGAPSYQGLVNILEVKSNDYYDVTNDTRVDSIRYQVSFLKKQEELLKGAGIKPYLFSWMMLFDQMEADDRVKFCPVGTSMILYSPKILDSFGYKIHIYKGPKSQDELDLIYPAKGARHRMCYWDSESVVI
ncbi:hypothetical protein ACJJI4_08165 [Microbulbifer sp. TRSA002]|uniref:hypothetical protein n=1 Tax=Microbulbifer sp. TRSA002 TaxID=3243382 RepID=UPI0040397BE1